MWYSILTDTVSIEGSCNAIPEYLQDILQHQTLHTTYNCTYLHGIKCEEECHLTNCWKSQKSYLKKTPGMRLYTTTQLAIDL